MTWLVENPLPTMFVGGLTAAVLAVAYYQTRRGVLLVALAGVVVLAGVLLLVERLVVTDVERIDATILAAAAALERNDRAAVLAHISPSPQAAPLRELIDRYVGSYEFEKISISGNRQIDVNRQTSPHTARAVLVASGQVRLGGQSYQTGPRRVELALRREGDRWLLIALDHRSFGG